jgi:hypothetical protein
MNWVPMLNYSLKHKVSLSTLRRRIKAQLIDFKLEAGRYLIKDVEISNSINNYPKTSSLTQDVSQMLIQELKKAYGAVLSEKEEMILQLKNEIEDLRKINSLLEKEMDRIGRPQGRPKDLFE